MISQSTIQAVKESSIANIIGAVVTLKHSGKSLTGCCPFHNERSPSFHVNETEGYYHCFGCGSSGDIIKFVMDYENKTFAEAITAIAKQQNIAVEFDKETTAETKQQIDRRQAMIATIRAAANHYQKNISKEALEYLHSRNFTDDTIAQWKIGFAPADFKFITSKVIEANCWQHALDAGIVKTKDGNNYDFFYNRIIIPIENKNGDIIAFSGRKLPDDATESPKYINTPATELYDKSKTLFGLSHARRGIKNFGYAFLVEGNLDVIKMHQQGQDNAVATCGTALTQQHSQLLRKYTDKVVILRDGDKAGINAVSKDIEILSSDFSNIKLIILPDNEDPDTLFDKKETDEFKRIISQTQDAFIYQCSLWLTKAKDDFSATATALQQCANLLSKVDQVQREMYIEQLSKTFKIPAKRFQNLVTNQLQELTGELLPEDELPKWVDSRKLYTNGFVMNRAKEQDKIGIYFKSEAKPVVRLTNYCIQPIGHIIDPNNYRRLVEVFNGIKTAVIELPNRAFTSKEVFETEIIARGAFYSEPGFGPMQYRRLANYLVENMNTVHELNTLGWQPEGCFAFSNVIIDPLTGANIQYDDYGMAKFKDYHFLSPGISKTNEGLRVEENNYENDLYLKHVKAKITFKQWSQLFCSVYDEHGKIGIAFIFIAAFKDIVTKVTKCPLAYFYGPKGSGKSAMAESMMWFFFSGKNAEGKLIQGYNLNPGQGTPFSFFSRLKRFRNVFMLFNEYDPNSVEFWKKGAFKSSYDGEGREVGSGETGKKRKTEIQKVQCVAGIAGQYLDTTDDGSVMSRSVLMKFSLEKNKNRTDEQKDLWMQLTDHEMNGISSLLGELYQYRKSVEQNLKEEFWKIQSALNIKLREKRIIAEARILNNYSLVLSMVKVMLPHVSLPFTYDELYADVFVRITEHARILSDNNLLTDFWKTIEVLIGDGFLQEGVHFKIREEAHVMVKTDNTVQSVPLNQPKEVLYIQMNFLYDKYAKRYKEIKNKTAPNEDTLIVYLKDQPYFIGLCPGTSFKSKKTSAYMIDYSTLKLMGFVFEKIQHNEPEQQNTNNKNPQYEPQEDLPF